MYKKGKRPYKNRFDLPGGSQKENEGLTETLVREFREETGYQIKNYRNCRVYDVFVKECKCQYKNVQLFKTNMIF